MQTISYGYDFGWLVNIRHDEKKVSQGFMNVIQSMGRCACGSDFTFVGMANTILGKWGMLVSVAGMACVGIVYIFNRQDMSEGFKMFLQVVFGICFIAFASQIVNALFSFSGAVI